MITHNGIWAIKLLGNNDFRFFFFFLLFFFFVANFAFSDNDVRTYLKKKKRTGRRQVSFEITMEYYLFILYGILMQ